MPNTSSAKKAVRNSNKKRSHNLTWKVKYKDCIKDLKRGLENKEDVAGLNSKLLKLQKLVDKAAKEKVIHKNKANRLKSIYAGKIAAQSKAKVSKSAKPKSGK